MAEPEPTHDMMIAALNRILGECGYRPVPAQSSADRLISEARSRADDIVTAAEQTAVRYTDDALDRAARTLMTVRREMIPALAPADLTQILSGVVPGPADAPVGEAWHAAVTAAGVYLPTAQPVAARAFAGFAARLLAAAQATPTW